MYHSIVRQVIIQGFESLSKGDYDALLKQFSPQVHYLFEGQHAMGGERHSLTAVRQWFQRIFRLFPGLQFKVNRVVVSGWPWDTTAAVQLQVAGQLRNGAAYQNGLVQFLKLRWGKVVDVYTLENLQTLMAALDTLAKQGVDEATAAPIAG
jgi:ketosteroid isomerase-like protein